MRGPRMLRYTAPFLVAGFITAVSSKGFAGGAASVLLVTGAAVMMAGCAVMAAACSWDAVDEWKRQYGRSRP